MASVLNQRSRVPGPGARLGAFVLGEPIADGGFGRVWFSTRQPDGMVAAVKVLHRELAGDPAAVKRFEREAWAMNALCHPNVVELLGSGRLDDGRPWLAMELVGGIDLGELVMRDGPLAPGRLVELMIPLCSALAAAHAAQIIHRDVKPGNVMLESGTGRVVLLDFGVAKLLDGEPITERRRVVGTPSCMAPEQIQGRPVDARTDVYALGLLAFHLLTGRPLFGASADETAVERQHLYHPRPRTSAHANVGPALDAVILRAVDAQPVCRHAGPLELLDALMTAVGPGPGAPVGPAGR